MSELDEWLKPGAGVPVNIRTVGILVHEIMRLHDEVAMWKERFEAVQADFERANKSWDRAMREAGFD